MKEACEPRDVTRPNPIGASVYVGTSDSSRLALRSPAELAGAGTPRGGFAGGLPQRRLRPLPGVPFLGPRRWPWRPAGSASRLCSRRTCRRENEPEGHAGASVCRGVRSLGRAGWRSRACEGHAGPGRGQGVSRGLARLVLRDSGGTRTRTSRRRLGLGDKMGAGSASQRPARLGLTLPTFAGDLVSGRRCAFAAGQPAS